MAGHLVLVDFAGIADGLEYFAGIQGQPPLAVGIPGGVCDDEVSVKLRIQRSRGVVAEGGGADVPADLGLPGQAGAIGGKAFQLGEGRGGRPVVSGVQALVLESDCHDGDALLSRALEVEEADSILRSSRCQPAGAVRQEVPAQGLKGGIVLADGVSGETQPLRPLPHPDAGDQLVFAVVVVGGQMTAQVGTPVFDLGASEHGQSVLGGLFHREGAKTLRKGEEAYIPWSRSAERLRSAFDWLSRGSCVFSRCSWTTR